MGKGRVKILYIIWFIITKGYSNNNNTFLIRFNIPSPLVFFNRTFVMVLKYLLKFISLIIYFCKSLIKLNIRNQLLWININIDSIDLDNKSWKVFSMVSQENKKKIKKFSSQNLELEKRVLKRVHLLITWRYTPNNTQEPLHSKLEDVLNLRTSLKWNCFAWKHNIKNLVFQFQRKKITYFLFSKFDYWKNKICFYFSHFSIFFSTSCGFYNKRK